MAAYELMTEQEKERLAKAAEDFLRQVEERRQRSKKMKDPTGHEVKSDLGEPTSDWEPQIADFLNELTKHQARTADALERLAAVLEKQEERLKRLQGEG